MQTADKKLPEVPDVVMDGGDSCEAQLKRAKTIMGLAVCVLEAQHDVYDETTEELTNLAETSGENVTDEDAVSTEVTGELDQRARFFSCCKARTVVFSFAGGRGKLFFHAEGRARFFFSSSTARIIAFSPAG